jgi:hypothetical protein
MKKIKIMKKQQPTVILLEKMAILVKNKIKSSPKKAIMTENTMMKN